VIKASLREIFNRDLIKLKKEISLFSNEQNLWLTPGEINNSSGNLCLHICGNLQHFIGAIIGKTEYKRKRELEFSLTNVPRVELIKNIDKTISIVDSVLLNMNEMQFLEKYPVNVFDEDMTTEFFLIHLTTHLNYHLGQINYLRRILTD
jgi:uncharacterized damage-inducible protein DinB